MSRHRSNRPLPKMTPSLSLPALMRAAACTFFAIALISSDATAADEPAIESPAPKVYPAGQLAAAGVRMLKGKHLVLYTDVASSPEVDELPQVFDLAVPKWCAYFEVDSARLKRYVCTAYLIKEKEKFLALGMVPPNLPQFLNGYARGFEVWLYDQPSAYYRRHLLLHEGTHVFMHQVLGGMGPPWYAEGMAELCGTHRWEKGQLTLAYLPRSREEVPYWGRVKIVKDEYAASRGLDLETIVAYSPTAHLKNEPYGWCWAACQFLDAHPQTQGLFRAMRPRVRAPGEDFSREFLNQLEPSRPQVMEDWQLFVANMEYGYDVPRAAVVRKKTEPVPAGGGTARIGAARGWQSSGLVLEAGKKYTLSASGRYTLAKEPKPWECEPNGITLHYYQGQPLGLLLGAIRDDKKLLDGTTPLAKPGPIGLGRSITPQTGGTLYLKINESAADLADNSGQLTVKVMAE